MPSARGPDSALGDVQAFKKRRWVKSPEPMVNSSSFERINGRKLSVAVDLSGPLVGFLAKSALSASAISAALGRHGESRLD